MEELLQAVGWNLGLFIHSVYSAQAISVACVVLFIPSNITNRAVSPYFSPFALLLNVYFYKEESTKKLTLWRVNSLFRLQD